MPNKDKNNNKVGATGLDSNIAGTLAYSVGLVTGLLFLVVEKDDKYVRFHAIQAIMANLAAIVINWLLWISIIGIIFLPFWGITVFVLWIVLMIKAYKGEEWELPLVGKYAKEWADR